MTATAARPWQPVATGAVVAGAGLVAAGGAGLLMPLPMAAAGLGYLGGAAAILLHWHRRRFGVANLVTLSRVVGTCWVIGLVVQAVLGRLSAYGLLAIILVAFGCLVLDGVDGTVARAYGESSRFGARFDVETDAALLLALSVVVPILGLAGWWVVAIGGMRYAYVVAARITPRSLRRALRIPLPYHYSGKVVAVIQVVALLIALILGLTGVATTLPVLPSVPLAAALTLLCWSFGRDVAWQLRAS